MSNIPHGPSLVHVAPAPPASEVTEALPVAVTHLHQPLKTTQLRADLKSHNIATIMPRWPSQAIALAYQL
jgi:hypothetical protein